MLSQNHSSSSCSSRKVIQGTCGWTDQSLIQCGRFYPGKRTQKSSERLEYYSRAGGFGCVEVDCSSYALQQPENVEKWVAATPKDFKFHFKVFGLFSNMSCESRYIPNDIKTLMKSAVGDRVEVAKLGENVLNELWRKFNQSVYPAYKANKLGIILFQFQNNFSCGQKSIEHIKYCCRNLDPRYKMAIEFRNRDWISTSNIESTLALLKSLREGGVVLVASDDLPHEMSPSSSLQSHKDNSNHYNSDAFRIGDNLAYDTRSSSLPTVLTCRPSGICAYIRVHRRHGNNRVLSDQELSLWSDRIIKLLEETNEGDNSDIDTSNTSNSSSSSNSNSDGSSIIGMKSELDRNSSIGNNHTLNGPVYFLWGTDHEDQGIINSRKFQQKIPEAVRLHWSTYYKSNQADSKLAGMLGLNNGPGLIIGQKRPLVAEDKLGGISGQLKTFEEEGGSLKVHTGSQPSATSSSIDSKIKTDSSSSSINNSSNNDSSSNSRYGQFSSHSITCQDNISSPPSKKSILNYFSAKKLP